MGFLILCWQFCTILQFFNSFLIFLKLIWVVYVLLDLFSKMSNCLKRPVECYRYDFFHIIKLIIAVILSFTVEKDVQ